ncbi:hypothetical protein QCA50_001083 [Cerrena zonata]|uniref:DUF7923 domain-containing protein n=1 Tax=Cerrena zonata TaxID=2478898 RepID=A0AAW0GSB9_9APHY
MEPDHSGNISTVTTVERRDEFEFHIQGLTGLVQSLRSRIGDLERQLKTERRSSQFKYDESTKQWEKDKRDLHILKYSERRVVCLIDGDGTLFSRDLLNRGNEGGQQAAQTLAERIRTHLREQDSIYEAPFELFIYSFLNKKGLADSLTKARYISHRPLMDEFLVGFNQAGDRFLMVDVGSGKENADAKIRAFLADYARSPYTLKMFLGLSHDNGYVPALNELISNGHREKLVLLPGYSEIAAGIQKLNLPVLMVQDLFLLEKIPSSRFNTPRKGGGRSLPSSSPKSDLHTTPSDLSLDGTSDDILDRLSTFPPIRSSRPSSFSGSRPSGLSLQFGSAPDSSPLSNNDVFTSSSRNVRDSLYQSGQFCNLDFLFLEVSRDRYQ